MAAAFALVLGSSPEVWVETRGLPDAGGACSSDALAAALRAQRPGVVVHAWHAETDAIQPSERALRVRLTQREDTVVLELNGAGTPIVRTMSATEGCERNVATAALIVDGALDELRISAKAPSVESLAPPVPLRRLISASVAIGAGTEQGLFGLVPAFDVEAAFRYRSFLLTLDADVGLSSSTGFSVTMPETGSGTFSASQFALDLGAGVAPRLGPGRLVAQAVFGLGLTFASANPASGSSPTAIFQTQTETSKEPFGALRLGYQLDLPLGLFLEAHAEERAAPRDGFQVVGAKNLSASTPHDTVMSPILTFRTFGFVGVHFL
jgi:hypothetical protein